MNVIKCKMCGGDLEIKQGSTIAVCTYCGTQQTVLTADNERKTKLYNRAHELRLNNDFDQALGVFETIIAEFPDEAEAYWGLCLCKYGIEYVDDPITKLKVPTCHRTCYDSIMNDDDYRRAVDLAGITARNLYYNEAIQIDAIQRTILTIARNERPYDIFICYKESDGRQRTKDSVLAQDIYDALVDQGGYKVFFSRITLEDKLGEEFEPYIFSALNTAKVMLVVGTSNSNMNSAWVKNEWSRYLKLMKGDKGKLLIPCYADMDAYELPEEFRNLQAQDMNKIGFMQDLLRGIKKVVNSTGVRIELPVNSAGTDVGALLKRVSNFIEDNNWTAADQYCEKVLDIDPDNVQAYLYKLLIDKRVVAVDDLRNCSDSFESNVYYQRLIKIADESLKQDLKGYLDYIKDKNDRARIAREKAERKRQKELALARKKRKRAIVLVTIISILISMITAGIIAVVTVVIPNNKYNRAVSLKNDGKLLEAEALFKGLGSYKDSKDQLIEIAELIMENDLNQPAGETVVFGMYEQDGDTSDGLEPIEWFVLENKAGVITLISKYELEYMSYGSCSWENSTLRKWLNEEFLNSAFSEYEKKHIIKSKLKNNSSARIVNRNTEDYIYALSIEEFERYISNDTIGVSSLTEFANKRIKSDEIKNQRREWWLRDVIEVDLDYIKAPYVDNTGEIIVDGASVDSNYGVRPVINIELRNSEEFKTKGITEIEIGDSIKFGLFEQDDNESNGPEPIDWCVMYAMGDLRLLISENILMPASMDFDENDGYQNSCMKLLNNGFYKAAFSEEEKSRIIKIDNSTVSYKDDTYVFMPTEESVIERYPSENDKMCYVTEYAVNKGVLRNGNIGGTAPWVLYKARDNEPGGKANLYAQVVTPLGVIQHTKGARGFGLRPAIWVNTNLNNDASGVLIDITQEIKISSDEKFEYVKHNAKVKSNSSIVRSYVKDLVNEKYNGIEEFVDQLPIWICKYEYNKKPHDINSEIVLTADGITGDSVDLEYMVTWNNEVVSSGECIGLHSGDKCTIKFRWSRTKERPGLKVTNKNTGEVLVDVSDVGLY